MSTAFEGKIPYTRVAVLAGAGVCVAGAGVALLQKTELMIAYPAAPIAAAIAATRIVPRFSLTKSLSLSKCGFAYSAAFCA